MFKYIVFILTLLLSPILSAQTISHSDVIKYKRAYKSIIHDLRQSHLNYKVGVVPTIVDLPLQNNNERFPVEYIRPYRSLRFPPIFSQLLVDAFKKINKINNKTFVIYSPIYCNTLIANVYFSADFMKDGILTNLDDSIPIPDIQYICVFNNRDKLITIRRHWQWQFNFVQ